MVATSSRSTSSSKITKVSADKKWVRFLLYGEPGVGKTILAGTSPKCLILDADDGTESAAVAGSQADVWHVNDWDGMLEASEFLRHEKHGYEWVWIDSISLFQELGLDQIMEDLVAEKPHRNRYVPDRGEYGQNMNRLSLLFRELKQLPINLGITAHVMTSEDEGGNEKFFPAVQGRGMPQKFCSYCRIVGYYTARTSKEGGTERILLTRKTSTYYAKDRYNALGGKLLNPTMPKIIDLIDKKLATTGATMARRPVPTPPRTRPRKAA